MDQSFPKDLAARGLALGDFDNDGSVDVLVTQNDGAPLLLRNNSGRRNHWLGVRLVGRKANIDAIGAKLSYQSGDLCAISGKWVGAATSPPMILVLFWGWASGPRLTGWK